MGNWKSLGICFSFLAAVLHAPILLKAYKVSIPGLDAVGLEKRPGAYMLATLCFLLFTIFCWWMYFRLKKKAEGQPRIIGL